MAEPDSSKWLTIDEMAKAIATKAAEHDDEETIYNLAVELLTDAAEGRIYVSLAGYWINRDPKDDNLYPV